MVRYYDGQLVGGEVLEMARLSDAVIGCLVGLLTFKMPRVTSQSSRELPIPSFLPCKLSGHYRFRRPELILPSVEQQHPAGAAIM